MVENVETQLKKSDQRIQWVDIAKGIAILLMIIGHEIPGGSRLYATDISFQYYCFSISVVLTFLRGYVVSFPDFTRHFLVCELNQQTFLLDCNR